MGKNTNWSNWRKDYSDAFKGFYSQAQVASSHAAFNTQMKTWEVLQISGKLSLELSLPVLYTANSIPVASPDFNFYLLNSGRLLTFTWIPPSYTAAWKLSPASKLENCRAHLVSLLSWINELCCLMSDFLFVWGKGINLASVNSATIRILHWKGVLYVKKMSLHIMLFHHFCCLFFFFPSDCF